MIPNFEELKKQLGELAGIVNGFKSEQVQLRIVEAVLANVTPVEQRAIAADPAKLTPKTKRKSNSKSPEAETGSTKGGSRKSPKQALEALAANGYFAQRRQIGEVVEHLKDGRALTFKTAVLQVALNRLVQNQQMQRAKNAETDQFEYWK